MVNKLHTMESADIRATKLNKSTDVIPKGEYCYSIISFHAKTGKIEKAMCPYWSVNSDANINDQESGYCSFLGRGDWQVKTMSLLWDMVKECGENPWTDEDIENGIDINN